MLTWLKTKLQTTPTIAPERAIDALQSLVDADHIENVWDLLDMAPGVQTAVADLLGGGTLKPVAHNAAAIWLLQRKVHAGTKNLAPSEVTNQRSASGTA